MLTPHALLRKENKAARAREVRLLGMLIQRRDIRETPRARRAKRALRMMLRAMFPERRAGGEDGCAECAGGVRVVDVDTESIGCLVALWAEGALRV